MRSHSYLVCDRIGTTVSYEPLVPGTGGINPVGINGWFAYRIVGADTPVFVSQSGEPLTVSGLAQALKRAARRAAVKGAHLHKFRHTFAVRFLELGGHPDDLRELLGHESYAMVRHYTRDRAQERALKAHARFSPGDSVRL